MFNFNNDAGEAVDPEEVEDEVEVESDDNTEPESKPSTTNDPLDAITDPDARAEAKRLRAINQRKERKEKEKESKEETPATPANYATKDDLKLMATHAAKEKVAPEVKELWDELVAIPLGGFDPLNAESIATNMQKRYNLYKLDHPDESSDPTKTFTSSPDTSVKGGIKAKPDNSPNQVNLPGYKEPIPPTSWY